MVKSNVTIVLQMMLISPHIRNVLLWMSLGFRRTIHFTGLGRMDVRNTEIHVVIIFSFPFHGEKRIYPSVPFVASHGFLRNPSYPNGIQMDKKIAGDC